MNNSQPIQDTLAANDLASIIALAPVGMIISHTDGRFIYVNAALRNILGYSEEEIYQPHIIISHPDDIEQNKRIRERLISQPNIPIVTEKRYAHKNGRTILGLISIVALPDANSNAKYFVAQIINIDNQKKIEKSVDLFRHMINSSQEAMFIVDPKTGNMLDANINGCKKLGYSYQEILNLRIFDIEPELQRDNRWDKNIATIRNTKSIIHYGSQRHKDNNIYPVEMHLNHIEVDRNEYIIVLSKDISEQKKAKETIWYQANYDSLTQLANRHYLYKKLHQFIQQCEASNEHFAVIYLDIDNFKEVNDAFGHSTGDALLVEISQRINRLCNDDNGTAGRISGDSFCLLIPYKQHTSTIQTLAHNILDTLSTPFSIGAHKIFSSASIGISLFKQHTSDADTLLTQSNQAMQAAKANGRNCFQFFTLSMQEKALDRIELSRDLHSAIANGELYIEYQPIFCFQEDTLKKVEALLRWKHPMRGIVSPTEFIPIAEENGLIDAIGYWLFSEVIRTIQHWQEKYDSTIQVSINASPLYFREGNDILTVWQQQLLDAKLSSDAVIIEITEGLLLDTSEHTTKLLLQLRDSGIQVALDDFGTGYSSLAYLKRLDIDYLKIDKSFIDNIQHASNEEILCEAIIAMAHKLNLQVIAEGIETKKQYDIIKLIGCNYGQGFLYSKPLSAKELASQFLA